MMNFATTLDSTFPSIEHSEESCKSGLRGVKNSKKLECQGQPLFLGLQGGRKRYPGREMGWELSLLSYASLPSMERKHPWVTHPAFIL